MRFRWYRQVEKCGKTVGEACDIFGISRKTYYKWYRRDYGLGSNEYKSRAIHPHTKLTQKVQTFIVSEKLKYNYGPTKMKIRVKDELGLDLGRTSIYEFMKKKQLIRKPQKKQSWYMPIKKPFKAQEPGENVQLDVKYVPGPKATWLYQFRFIDTVTNLQHVYESGVRDSVSAIRAFQSAERSFPFEISGIQTDNGGEFRGVLHEYLIKHSVTHRYIPKRSAPWNGKVERANRSVDDEFFLNKTRPWKTLRAYTRWYNHERPHLGKGMNGMTPYEKLLSLQA